MRRRSTAYLVWVTSPDLKTARRLARVALEDRLVACAQIRTGVESHYWWQSKLQRAMEVLITFKTTADRLKALEEVVVAQHPYDTPQFVAIPLPKGNRRFLAWIDAETRPVRIQRRP
jgi:periplasmic divalent cation tolerance protein